MTLGFSRRPILRTHWDDTLANVVFPTCGSRKHSQQAASLETPIGK